MSPGDGFVPFIIKLHGQSRVNQVVLINTNIESFDELTTSLYQSLRPNIPEFYLESGERRITQLWVEWNQNNDFLPRETEVFEHNMHAALRLIEKRGGIDLVRVWLNEID